MECFVCDGDVYASVDYPPKNNPLRFSEINLCQNCGLGRAFPALNQGELDAFYKGGNYWGNNEISTSFENYLIAQSIKRIKSIHPYLNKKKVVDLFDIGSGSGAILNALVRSNIIKSEFINYHFYEPDIRISDSIKKINIENKNIQIIHEKEIIVKKKFDLIFLNHVLEHSTNPIEFLGKLKQCLGAKSILYIETPSYDFKFKEDVFPHTLFFIPKTYIKIAEKISFEVLNIEEFGIKRYFYPVSFYQKMIKRIYFNLISIFENVLPKKIRCYLYFLLWKKDKNPIWIKCIYRDKSLHV